MEELESQNDAAVEGLSAKVKMLKDVSITRVLVLALLALPRIARVEGVEGLRILWMMEGGFVSGYGD